MNAAALLQRLEVAHEGEQPGLMPALVTGPRPCPECGAPAGQACAAYCSSNESQPG